MDQKVSNLRVGGAEGGMTEERKQEKKPCVWLGRRGTVNGRRTQRQWEERWDDHSSSFVSARASQDIPQQGPGTQDSIFGFTYVYRHDFYLLAVGC